MSIKRYADPEPPVFIVWDPWGCPEDELQVEIGAMQSEFGVTDILRVEYLACRDERDTGKLEYRVSLPDKILRLRYEEVLIKDLSGKVTVIDRDKVEKFTLGRGE